MGVALAVSDLTGVLAAAGQIVTVGGGARLSVVVDQVWRAQALGRMIDEAGLTAEITVTDRERAIGCPERAGVDAGLRPITPSNGPRGAVKTVPPLWLPGPRELRAWILAAGVPEADRSVLGLDPPGPDTRWPLASALMRTGAWRQPAHRHPRSPARAADQRPPSAITPGRGRLWGTP